MGRPRRAPRKPAKLKPRVYPVPQDLDLKVARLKLDSLGIRIDRLTKEQRAYLDSWQEGT